MMNDVPHSNSSADREAALRDVADHLVEADRVAVLTGAGISAASGVPTFRGEDGLWKQYRAEELATPEAFGRDPDVVWEWYGWRRRKIHAARPNPGHRAIASLARGREELVILTQNVDGLHHMSLEDEGVDDVVEVVELHGNMWVDRCCLCSFQVRHHEPKPAPGDPLARCQCGALLRPGVVWFGESLDERNVDRALRAARLCDVFLMAGTSAVVYPAASFASIAKEAGAYVAEFNLEPTPFTGRLDASVLGPSEVTLPEVVRLARQAGGTA